MLEKVNSPQDIKDLSLKELENLAAEVRDKLIKTVSENGGHLASNLGTVELTIALHTQFNSPDDKIIFDVGHQAYTHKLLTGRRERFDTLRKKGGISGFCDRFESEHDVLNEGHCGTSVSEALGIAVSNKLKGNDNYAVAVVGDGALTNGMVYEALNNCADNKLKLVIILNDNEMSISRNVGGLHNYLVRMRSGLRYFRFKHRTEKFLLKIPLIGKFLASGCRRFKNFIKRMFLKESIFEDLGLTYLGPVDGHNIKKLQNVLRVAKMHDSCCVVHVCTTKGKGYEHAEKEPWLYHSVGKFNPETGVEGGEKKSFSSFAGGLLCAAAEKDDKVCAITAAMGEGCGLTEFAQSFPERYFDVGIAEEHAITFAAGLAVNGMKPVAAIYSTFAQRSYDQLLHDISLQKLPLVLLLDRSGLVPDDGITHQGIFDCAAFSTIPNTEIYSPETYEELERGLNAALNHGGLSVVRYPKGGEAEEPSGLEGDGWICKTENAESAKVVILTYGRLASVAVKAAEIINGMRGENVVGVVKLVKIFPLDYEKIASFATNAELLYILEEGIKQGGVGEKIAAYTGGNCKKSCKIHAVEGFVGHGTVEELFNDCGFTAEKVAENILIELQ
ncbi:MAG: 1-deoxy-D-xylulose-5-phosphate synthase [Clostridia bacterium]|nr:1-deoxy-D-xylulose-5-phosphate synthase [Clostridia bacterium]